MKNVKLSMTGTYFGPLTDYSQSPSARPYYPMVPKGYVENLKWRKRLIRLGQENEDIALDLAAMCSRDPLFWLNSFVWTYNPRPGDVEGGLRIPFISYEYQDLAFLELIAATGLVPGIAAHDLLLEKSRDMGATWMCIAAHTWCWLYRPASSFLWISAKEDLVDKPEDPSALFWKFDFLVKWLPSFLTPRFNRQKLHAANYSNGATIDGQSTTGESGRSDRRTGLFIDEAAFIPELTRVLRATRDVTDNRVLSSTPNSTGNDFYAWRESPNKQKLSMHWSMHPIKNRAMYTAEAGKLVMLDEDHELPEGYTPILDGKVRSPFYDRECEREVSRVHIASELDLDYHASGSQFFDTEILARCRRDTVRRPDRVGRLTFTVEDLEGGRNPHAETRTGVRWRIDPASVQFVDDPAGDVLLWTTLDPQNKPLPNRRYAVGVDTSAGSDASNSAASFVDRATGEKVCEIATINTLPDAFAKLVVAACLWLKQGNAPRPFVVPESNGPGQMFIKVALELGYFDMYFRRPEMRLSRKPTDNPGWHSSPEAKRLLLEEYRRALGTGMFVNRSEAAIAEAAEYVYTPTSVMHAREQHAQDPSGARLNHGDRVMADALAYRGVEDRPVQRTGTRRIPPNSHAGRRRKRKQRARELAEAAA